VEPETSYELAFVQWAPSSVQKKLTTFAKLRARSHRWALAFVVLGPNLSSCPSL
jgi:hypothetical protein